MWSSPTFTPLLPYVLNVLDRADSDDFVVFDIDDTVLHGMGDRVVAVPSGLGLVKEAEARNLGVYYVTARPDYPVNRRQTYADLNSVGIRDPAMLVMRPQSVTSWYGIGRFKQQSRDMLQSRHGGKCVLTVGDRWTDMMTMDEDKMDLLNDTIGNKFSLFQFLDKNGWGLKLKET
jgi:hypothetical protein